MQQEENKINIIEPQDQKPQTNATEKKEEKPKILKNAIEKYPFKIKKKMSNKEANIYLFPFLRKKNEKI
jgi:hypothetical protein